MISSIALYGVVIIISWGGKTMRKLDLPIYQRKHELEEKSKTKLEKLKQKFSLFLLTLGAVGLWSSRVVILDDLMPLGISYLSFFLYCRENEFINKKNDFIIDN